MQLAILVGQVEGSLLKSGRFRPDNYINVTPLLLRFGLVDLDLFIYFQAPNLLEGKLDCPAFSGPATRRYCHPFINAT